MFVTLHCSSTLVCSNLCKNTLATLVLLTYGCCDKKKDFTLFFPPLPTVLKTHDRQYSAVESMLDQLQAKRDQLKTTELQIAGQPTFEPVTAGNLFRKIGSVFDSNPQQTLRDNAVKLQGTIEALEKETDEANSAVTKSSEAILNDFNLYEQSKAADFKAILTHYAKSELDYHQKVTSSKVFPPVGLSYHKKNM